MGEYRLQEPDHRLQFLDIGVGARLRRVATAVIELKHCELCRGVGDLFEFLGGSAVQPDSDGQKFPLPDP
ncbi:hypothetical protein [Actinocrinis puniceicyclus]|uniref:hypothetical protein n=1 Tax=Actinocrinis puniceicyclus TaxID=977794 RepID=UPI001B8CE49F|nr:hypothetical protein [Actinocrinis puniceicyclus]